MKRYVLAAMSVVTIAIATAYSQARDSKLSIEGSWLLTGSTTPAGAKIPQDLVDKLMGKLIFSKGGAYEQHAVGTKIEAGKFKIDAAKKPAWIDLEVAEGRNKGKSQLGIIKIEDGKLTVALGKVGSGERPKDFADTRKAEVSTYQRAN
jgi:uncharacterized protein (TIGR03067 family)